jgi:hypothetical protein
MRQRHRGSAPIVRRDEAAVHERLPSGLASGTTTAPSPRAPVVGPHAEVHGDALVLVLHHVGALQQASQGQAVNGPTTTRAGTAERRWTPSRAPSSASTASARRSSCAASASARLTAGWGGAPSSPAPDGQLQLHRAMLTAEDAAVRALAKRVNPDRDSEVRASRSSRTGGGARRAPSAARTARLTSEC